MFKIFNFIKMQKIKIIECPRDAMQGVKQWIPTEKKITYLQSLLRVGYDTLDCGSFVSPKAIPQMRDTPEVISRLDLSETNTKLLTIVANERGANKACEFEKVTYLGFPFSISENFQMRNTHKTIADSIRTLDYIINISAKHNKKVVVYLSMGFGNPYGDPWNTEIVLNWTNKLSQMGVNILSLSDTVGTANPVDIKALFSSLIPTYPAIEFGAHFHTDLNGWYAKVDAAYAAGCLRFDAAIMGHGGCPMANDSLVGNLPTERLISYLNKQKAPMQLNSLHFESAYNFSKKIFL